MKLCFTCSCNWKTNLYWKYKKGPYINDADKERKGRYNESKIFLDVVRGGRRGDCCSFRRPLSIFFTLQNATNRVQEFPVIFSSLSVSKRSAQPQQRIIFGMSVSCFMCFVWMFWCSELAKCFFFALNIYLSVRDNWDHLSLATIKISANKKSWPDNSSHGSVNCTCTNDQIWACYQSTEN